MSFDKISRILLISITVLLWSCVERNAETKPEFISTKYQSDINKHTVIQLFEDPNSNDFIVVFYKESSMSFGSGNNIIKLYSKDSFSIDENFYGAHPLEVSYWKDSIIFIDCSVYSAHGDSIYRKKYLDNSVDKNMAIGKYKIEYIKNYNLYNE